MAVTVYLLDDEEALVELHSEVVKMSGLIARAFTRASQFFEQITHFESGSILMLDLQMPEMDGIEVMRRLATMHNPPELILISGHDIGVLNSAEKLCRAHGLKVLASLSKPLSLDYLSQLLKQHRPDDSTQKQPRPTLDENEFDAEGFRRAISQNEMLLYYQPQIDIATGEMSGLEALARWQHPEYGLINLETVIPHAEKLGVMGELTEWVIDTAVKQEQQWQQEGYQACVSVNISASDITSLSLPEKIATLLEDNRLDPTRFKLEVTESALMGELVTSLDILTRLRLKGIGLSIDDFGTGYSSLSQLHKVPFTELKIDRSFVSNMTEDAEALAIVKTCIMLGHELKMRVVAEGVEKKVHFSLLQQMGCDIAQGYFIAKPMPAESVSHWVNSRQQL